MKIIITGANGYLGSRLSWYLSHKGHKITAVCYPEIPDDKNWVQKIHKTIVGDIKNNRTIEELANLNADAIIHLVSLNHYDSEKDPDFVNSVNVSPTWNLLDSCTKKGLKKFIYFSTIHVYGKNQQGVVTEERKPTPYNTYGLTHLLCEEIVNNFNRKTHTDCKNIRLSNSYGEPLLQDANCWDIVVNNLCLSAIKKNRIILKGDGSPLRDFIHYETICDSVNNILNIDFDKEYNTIQLSSGRSYSMLELAFIVKYLYIKRYNLNIEVYINNDELINKNVAIENNSIISNKYLNSKAPLKLFSMEEGINRVFDYLELT
jgi:UDP-glucose 4-epimerase